MSRNTKTVLGSLQGMGDKNTFAGIVNTRKMCFDLVGNAQKISVDGFGIDVSGLESDI